MWTENYVGSPFPPVISLLSQHFSERAIEDIYARERKGSWERFDKSSRDLQGISKQDENQWVKAEG